MTSPALPRPPLLVLAIGNDQRGDDAAGPLLLQRLADAGFGADGSIELLGDYQLQVEHALDVAGRRAVLFVDAAHHIEPLPGALAGDGWQLAPVAPLRERGVTSHALSPAAVLQVALDLGLPLPPCGVLAIQGDAFELGAGPSVALEQRLEGAEAAASQWLRGHAPAGASTT